MAFIQRSPASPSLKVRQEWCRSCATARERWSPCWDPARQSTQDTTKKKTQSGLLEVLACPKDVLKWIPMGGALAWMCFLVLPTPRDVKVTGWGRALAQCFIQLSQLWLTLFCEENCRRGVLEGCSTDLMGIQVSPKSASGLARCVNNEPDLKLLWWDRGTSWIQMHLNWLKVLEWFILMLH